MKGAIGCAANINVGEREGTQLEKRKMNNLRFIRWSPTLRSKTLFFFFPRCGNPLAQVMRVVTVCLNYNNNNNTNKRREGFPRGENGNNGGM